MCYQFVFNFFEEHCIKDGKIFKLNFSLKGKTFCYNDFY